VNWWSYVILIVAVRFFETQRIDIRVRLLSLIVWIYLHLFHTLMWGLENSARRCVTVVLGHSRSSKLVPTESPCACDFLFGCWVDRLETLAFDCFIQEQTEEFSVSCCLHREHFVNSGMRHRSDRERTTSHMLLLLLFVFHCNCAYLSSFPRRNRVYAKMIRRIFAPSLTLALSQRSSKARSVSPSSTCAVFG